MKPREVKELARSHVVSERQSQNPNPKCLTPEPVSRRISRQSLDTFESEREHY